MGALFKHSELRIADRGNEGNNNLIALFQKLVRSSHREGTDIYIYKHNTTKQRLDTTM